MDELKSFFILKSDTDEGETVSFELRGRNKDGTLSSEVHDILEDSGSSPSLPDYSAIHVSYVTSPIKMSVISSVDFQTDYIMNMAFKDFTIGLVVRSDLLAVRVLYQFYRAGGVKAISQKRIVKVTVGNFILVGYFRSIREEINPRIIGARAFTLQFIGYEENWSDE